MAIDTILTVGWPLMKADDVFDATNMHAKAEQADDYKAALKQVYTDLRKQLGEGKPMHISSVGRLFRRRPDHFGAIKKFVRNSEKVIDKSHGKIYFEIDAFSYAFLKGAKNFDIVMPETDSIEGSFRKIRRKMLDEMSQLEEFEREGYKPEDSKVMENYLALREVIASPAARDERRALATLLVSGPSTSEQIANDLGMPYGLSGLVLPVYEKIGVATRREELGETLFAITEEALPRVLFCLRETMGVDFIEVLESYY
ncbi:hypothetical protein [Candidatus Albibeggiatoa sp. nov. NOAA]|uniref:hypothetical protein n=1 Tax=Candidatus Albibeggiatoa sp. nov. NOAA TaxID=3162724 RepID=UPI0032FB6A50|nr:hypothetical protein [Thiotrichaceae bacterium]